MNPIIRATIDGILHVTVRDITQALAASYTQLNVYQATSSTGSFSTLTGAASLIATTTGYTVLDLDGDSTLYYKARLTDGATTSSSWSDARAYDTQAAYCLAFDVRQEVAPGSGQAAITDKHDHIIWEMCVEASRLIDRYRGVDDDAYMASASATRYINGSGIERLQLPWPAVSVSAVAVEENDGTYTSWTADADYYTWPYAGDGPITRLDVNPKSSGSKSVWTSGPKRVQVTAVWGVTATPPEEIARACKIQVAQWWKLGQQAWADSGGSPEMGQLEYPRKLDSAVMKLANLAPPRMARI